MQIKLNWKKIIAAVLFVAICVAVLSYCSKVNKTELISTDGQSFEKATVVKIIQDNLDEDGNRSGNQEVVLKINSGELKGQEVEATSPDGQLFGAACKEGMHVIAMVSVSGDTNVVSVYGQDRSIAIWGFVLIFILIVCLIGGWKGCKAILSLVFAGVLILYFLLPMIYRGFSPILLTIVICVLATIFTMIMIGGISNKTISATIGTTCGVAVAGIAALIFGHFAGITGYNVSDIETLNFIAQETPIKIGELLFSGIILSALGAVMDVGMSIASTIQEIYETDPTLGKKRLFLSGIHVGRDMMGTMVNTLILAYVGGSLSTLMTNYAYNLSYNQLMNSYVIGVEIMQGLAGSLGVVLTVPITAFVAVELIYRKAVKEKLK